VNFFQHSPLLRALSQPSYRRYAAGNAVSLVGNWVHRVAIGWLTWELTHSATWLGIVAFADLAPAVIFGPLGGAVADRRSPLRITWACQALAMVASALLTILTVKDLMTPHLLAFIAAGLGIVMGFSQPARLALVYSLVDREHLPSAIAFNSVMFNGARFIGPMVAGAALVWSGPGLAFGINTLSFIAFLIALAGITLTTTPGARGKSESKSIANDMKAGLRYAFSHQTIGPLLVFSAIVSVCVRGYVELLPGFSDSVLGGGAATLALLSSAMGVGAVCSGLWLANRRGGLASSQFLAGCVIGTSCAVAVFALSRSLVLSLVAVMFAGACMSMLGVSIQTFLQLTVDADYRARLMSIYGVIFRSGPAIGALIMGALADRMGLQMPVVAGAGAAAIAGVAFWHRMRRS
jgi:MFS family permease